MESTQAEERPELGVEDVDEPGEEEDDESNEILTVEEGKSYVAELTGDRITDTSAVEKREHASQLFTKLREQFRALRRT